MQLSLDQSYFGRVGGEDKALSRKRLRKILRGLVVEVIEFCRRESKKLKKRHEHQTILFPRDYEYEQSEEVSLALRQHHHRLASYPFYLTQSHLFIDNYHLKVLKKAPPLPTKFAALGYGQLREFASSAGLPPRGFLVAVTSLNVVLVIAIAERRFLKYRVEGRRKEEVLAVANASVHGDFLFVFSQQECHVLRFRNQREKGGLERVVQKAVGERITRGEGVEREGKFYAFLLVENALVLQRLEAGLLLSKIDSKSRVLYECKRPLVNLAIHPLHPLHPARTARAAVSHVVVAIATADEVKLLSYSFESEATTVFSSKESPLCFKRNTAAEPPLLQFIAREGYLLCAIAFRDRLYFARLEADYCEFSKRVKFDQAVEFVGPLGSGCGLVVVTNCVREGRNCRKLYVTHEEKLISYSEYVYTELIDKFELAHESAAGEASALCGRQAVLVYEGREVFMLGKGEIARVVLNSWQGIYGEMQLTENIKLLKFLLLLRHVPSPFLAAPSSFRGLEEFFPADCDEAKQVLLEYYYHMELEPARVEVAADYRLLVPFVLAHQVSNLGEAALEGVLEWSLRFDERLVEELIIGGANCGWEIAVSRGWVRAFKVMVDRGMELEMPVLKLYSMAYFQLAPAPTPGGPLPRLTPLGEKHLAQMIEYILFILASFFHDLLGNGSNLEFKHTLSVILQEELWAFMMRFAPVRAIAVIYGIFCSEARIREVNRFSPVDFIPFHRRFAGMRASVGCSNSETVVSHLSATFPGDEPEYLHMEHAKLMVLRYEEYLRACGGLNFQQALRTYQIFLGEPYYSDAFQTEFLRLLEQLKAKAYFRFHKDYEVEVLKTLIRDQGKHLEEVYFAARSSSGGRGFEEVECEMVDFLAFLWTEIYLGLVQEVLEEHGCDDERFGLEECDRRVKLAVRAAVRQILAEVDEGHEQFLSIHLLLASNVDGENSIKILGKFLGCKNGALRERVFAWLRGALGGSAGLQEEVIVRLKEVIAVNNEESRGLLERFYEGREKEIIKKIDHDPQLQLEYLELIIRNANEQLEPYYTNLHLRLLLRLKPHRLIDVLEANNEMVEYDIAEALRITLAAPDFDRKNDTLIYLYQREGELLHCINTYLTSFEILVFAYIALCERSRTDIEEDLPSMHSLALASLAGDLEGERARLVGEIDRKFEDSLRLLFRIPQRSYDHLARYLRKLNSIWKAVGGREYRFKAHYVQFVSGYFGELLVQLFERNCLLELAGWLEEERADLLDFFLQMQRFLVEGYDQMLIQMAILRSMSKMEKQMLLREIGEAVRRLEFCISSAGFCLVCERPFGEELGAAGLLFNCGHLYHRGCIEQVNDLDFCFHCVSRNQYKSMIENEALFLVELLKKFREKRRQKRSQQDIRVEGRRRDALVPARKKRANRLALYDKKATALENQAEIIDIKLLIDDYYNSQAKR